MSLGRNNKKDDQSNKQKIRPCCCKPKRPLSAYGLYFKHELGRILTSRNSSRPEVRSEANKKFAVLHSVIADKWNHIDTERLHHFENLAAVEKARYKKEKLEWKKNQIAGSKNKNKNSRKLAASSCAYLQKSVLQDFLQDFGSLHQDFGWIPDTSCSVPGTTKHESTQQDSGIDSNMEERKQREASTCPSPTSISSFLDESDLQHSKNSIETQSRLNSNAASKRTLFGDDILIPSSTIVALPKNELLDMSELAAKLDDECMDFLCGE